MSKGLNPLGNIMKQAQEGVERPRPAIILG